MEEIKVGEYVRTERGSIIKITSPRDMGYLEEGYTGFKKIIKNHSKNIIDLIQPGDYVNGILVTGKESTLLYTEIKGIDGSGYHIPISQYGEGIKTILTKELYQANCYTVERN